MESLRALALGCMLVLMLPHLHVEQGIERSLKATCSLCATIQASALPEVAKNCTQLEENLIRPSIGFRSISSIQPSSIPRELLGRAPPMCSL
ncbi:MAG: hypothetical protein K1X79_01145 [Oligoflexia bacterium]|nr:hypothetical protein [Oligoflexia bacterium]